MAYSEFFEDKGRLVLRQYYDNSGMPKIMMYYRGSDDNQPVLYLVQLNEAGKWGDFDGLAEFRVYFLDEICKNDPKVVMYVDHSDYTLDTFKLMKMHCPHYMVFHSALTINGQYDGDIFEIY